MTAAVDTREFRRTIGLFATGVAVVTAQDGEGVRGMTANSITSVSLEPLLVLVCIDRRAHMLRVVERTGRFAINVLSDQQERLSRHFSGKPEPGLVVPSSLVDGVPVLQATLATLVCTVDRMLDGGDHVIALARVDRFARAAHPPMPLLYFGGEYRTLALPEPAAEAAA